MKILVTGGAGFIASHITDKLIELGHDVIIIDNLYTGKRENINKKAKFIHADITDTDTINSILSEEKPDVVIHHAAQAYVKVSTEKPCFDAKVNILGSLNLIESSVKNNVKKFIYANSGGAGYGEPLFLPMPEDHPINPLSQYGIAKHTVEHYLFLYSKMYGLKYTSLRYANVYGPRQDPYGEGGVISIFTNLFLQNKQPKIFGDGSQKRDYVYVKDVVDANMLALTKGDNQAFNVGTSIATSTQEIFDKLKALTNSQLGPIYAPERKGDIKASSLNSDKLQAIGWKINYNLDSGLKETVEYVRNILVSDHPKTLT